MIQFIIDFLLAVWSITWYRIVEHGVQFANVAILLRCVGFFDFMMDGIKDFKHSKNFWLWRLVEGTKYEPWLSGGHSLPFFEARGYMYDAGSVLFADAWHQAKHGLLISFTGAIACAFGLEWWLQICLWWLLYWTEGEFFNFDYQPLKKP